MAETLEITSQVHQALSEDHAHNDVTADLLDPDLRARGEIKVRESVLLCGVAWVEAVFSQLDENIQIQWHGKDGHFFEADAVICTLEGPAKPLLSGERVALNFLQTLSGVATQTHQYCASLQGTNTKLLDTRKTLPGWRMAQKYAVRCGGGENHRLHLADAYLIKENHIIALGGLAQAVGAARLAHPDLLLEVEVETLDELDQALALGVNRIMLDNFDVPLMREAVVINNGRAKLEASGNIDNSSIAEIAASGVDYISVGALTKHIQAIDFSMRITLQ